MRVRISLESSKLWAVRVIQLATVVTSVLGFRVPQHKEHSPKPRFIAGGTNVTFHVGDTATLSCGINDLGTKTVTWKRADDLVPLMIGELAFKQKTDYEVHHMDPYWNLLIKNVQPKHAGVYKCIVSTRDKMTRLVQLNIYDDHKQHEALINISGQLHVDKGQTIKLLCNASGVSTPPDLVQWFKDGIEVQSTHRASIHEQYSVMSRTINSWLEISNAHMDDQGTYTCRTSDLQVTSVNINVLNAESSYRGEREKPQATKLDDKETSDSNSLHRHNTHLLLCTILITWLWAWSRDAS